MDTALPSVATGNPTLDLLLTRRSVTAKNLVPPGPSAEELDLILRAAVRVPDHGKLAPWRLQIVSDSGKEALGALWAAMFQADHPDANEKQIRFEHDRPFRAPVLIAATAKLAPHAKIPEWEMILSGGAVCQNLLLAATALGYGAQWLTEWPSYRAETVRLLGHDPNEDRILGFLYIGSKEAAPTERTRPDFATVVTAFNG